LEKIKSKILLKKITEIPREEIPRAQIFERRESFIKSSIRESQTPIHNRNEWIEKFQSKEPK
jgi:hypothetical protein